MGRPRNRRAESGSGAVSSANAEIKVVNGIPSLVIAGKAVEPIVGDVGRDATAAEIDNATHAGVRLFRLTQIDLGWAGPEAFDTGEIDARITALIAQAPDARFLIQVLLDAPEWWRRSHPAECARYLTKTEERQLTTVSWASRQWRREAGSVLARLVRHVHEGQAGSRCIGWHLCAGKSGEWRYPFPEDLPDSGPAMTAHFRHWTAEKYRRNTGLLRKAWFDSRADFPSISCPDARQRRSADFGILRDPLRSRRTTDYYESLSDAQNSAALHFCGVARKACDGKALVGLSYATISECAPEPEDGHGLPETVLDSPDVQFLANIGSAGGSYARAVTGSVVLRGKLLFHVPAAGPPVDQAGAVAFTLASGLIIPIGTETSLLQAVVGAMERARPISAKARHRISPIAVLVDGPNRHRIAEPAGQAGAVNSTLLTSQIEELSRVGAPFDLYLLSDLFHPGFPDYKVVVFLNAFYVSEAERRRVDARIKRSGTTAVWLWGAGLVGEEGVGAEYSRRLCGQKVRSQPGSISGRVRIAEANDPLTWGYHPGSQFGPERAISPILTAPDKASIRLGANTENKTAFSVRRNESWTSILIETTFVPAALLRNVLRAAGAHLYCDSGDAAMVTADSRSVAVTAAGSKPLQISLPGQFDVTDGWSNAAIARGANEITVTVPAGKTGYFELTRRASQARNEP